MFKTLRSAGAAGIQVIALTWALVGFFPLIAGLILKSFATDCFARPAAWVGIQASRLLGHGGPSDAHLDIRGEVAGENPYLRESEVREDEARDRAPLGP